MLLACSVASAQSVPSRTFDQVRQSVVKVYGAGGLAGLEAYQSGFLVSGEGHVATADSLVLEQGEVTVVLAAGDRYSGRVIGADPLLRVAVVKVDPAGESLAAVDLSQPAEPHAGEPLLAFSNMFNIATGNEDASVMRTHLAAVVTREAAFGLATPRGGDRLLLVDAVTSNPGAAGGLLTDYRGAPVGMIGVEDRGRVTGGWLNYAAPAAQVAASIERVIQGDRLLGERRDAPDSIDTLSAWGFVLVEDVVVRTPPYVEFVRSGAAAAGGGVRADDLLVMVDGVVTATVSEARRVLTLRSSKQVVVTLERDGKLVEATLPARPVEAREASK